MADTSATPFLHRLPIEVLHLVLAQFCEHCRREDALCALVTLSCRDTHWIDEERYLADTQDLRSLCLVSSTLRWPAQSVLHHMCMGGFAPNFRYAFRYTQLFRFVGSVATNDTPPRLVREVKALSLGHGHLQKMPKVWRRSLAMPEAAHLRAFMASEPDETNGIAKIDFIAKLITTFPALTHLSLGECADDSSDRVPPCLAQVEELPLTSIHVCANPGTGFNWSTKPSGLGKLTATVIACSKGLRMLAVDCCIETATILRSLQPRHSLAQLRVLRLTTAWLDEEELQQIIMACPILCGLAYLENGYGPHRGEPPKKTLLEPLGVVRALASCRQTLRSLDLQLATTKNDEDTTGNNNNSRLAASFAVFTALQDLTVQWRTVCDPISNEEHDDDDGEWQQLLVRAVPDGIRSLSVIGCADETRPERFGRALEGLAAAKAHNHRFPYLAHVGCDVDAMMDSRNRPDHENYHDDDVNPGHKGPRWAYWGYDEARDQEIAFGLFDPGNSIREALGAAGVRRVEYSMAWRTGFRSRARERAARREREIEGCMLKDRDWGRARDILPDSEESGWSDL
ncbi:hypothetical protein PG993_005458 [Apiospora rasikravindrae]|uniref:F-box domain-containing protein n=1 Tax=Apiospora rasikravindrae TaxID=990691 RepID=A0ABR1TFP2_9PEZI